MNSRKILCALCVLCVSISSSARAEDDPALVAKIDASISKATKFLADKQSPDGAWRSDVYAPFKEGDALTPLVLTALLPLPQDAITGPACEKGLNYLATLSKKTFDQPEGVRALAYPVYTAASTTLALHQWRRAEDDAYRAKWVQLLRDLQLTEATGWKPEDPEYGGWTYGHASAKKPAEGQPLGTLDQPNMSATAFAVTSLRVAGIGDGDPVFKKAVKFIVRCQNHWNNDGEQQPYARDDNDGGFYFVLNDAVRNKAGRQIILDDKGYFPSYGSATADGLRGLLACGPNADPFRVQIAALWLKENCSPSEHVGGFVANRREAKDGLYFYYVCFASQCINQIKSREVDRYLQRKIHVLELKDQRKYDAEHPNNVDKIEHYDWPVAVGIELARKQENDGSWKNQIVDQREDDPIVATSFAIQSLTACRAMLVAEKRQSVAQAADGSFTCAARDAVCHGEKLQYEPLPQKNTLGYWVNEKDFATWQLAVDQPGEFELIILQGCGGGQGGSEAAVQLDGDQELKFTVEETGHFQNFKSRSLGKLKITSAAPHELTIKALSKKNAAVMDVRQIRLVPTK